jgi:hypothetical protein
LGKGPALMERLLMQLSQPAHISHGRSGAMLPLLLCSFYSCSQQFIEIFQTEENARPED